MSWFPDKEKVQCISAFALSFISSITLGYIAGCVYSTNSKVHQIDTKLDDIYRIVRQTTPCNLTVKN